MSINTSGGVIGNQPHISGHRITVIQIVNHWLRGNCIEEIANELYPQLTEEEIEAALRFALEDTDRYDRLKKEWENTKAEIKDSAATSPSDIPEETVE